MILGNELRTGNKFLSAFGRIETVISIMDNTNKNEIEYKSENHKLMYSHLILCWENGNQYKPCEIEGIPLTPELLMKYGFERKNLAVMQGSEYWVYEKDEILLRWKASGLFQINPASRLNQIGGELKYLHQLQNRYFSLTDKELV